MAPTHIEKDVVVIGAGGAGMTAALVAACEGLDVLLAEKSDCYGGTTALSGGGVWVPTSSAAIKAGFADSKAAARRYVEQLVGDKLEQSQLTAFLDAAPEMIDYLAEHSVVRFELEPGFPDWDLALEGSVEDGRLLSPEIYDAKALGKYFPLLKSPLSEFNAPGGFMVAISDMPHIANATKSLRSFMHMSALALRFMADRVRYPRGTRLTMGNALAARLLRSNIDAGVTLWNKAPMLELVHDGDKVTGVVIERDGEKQVVMARKGVVLATGGFSANPEMRAKYFPFAEHHVTLMPETNTADGLTQAMQSGGVMEQDNISNAGWTVMSVLNKPDGSIVKFPHLFMDRPKPGCIAVNAEGKRFCNEADLNMVIDMHKSASVPAHLVCDHKFIKKYGLGLVKPGGFGLKKLVDAGYIVSADSLEELAQKIGANVYGLKETVARMNRFAEKGHDPDFGKGSSATDTAMGDPSNKPNPSLGPIDTAPFYGVKIFPGDSTSTLGLRVNQTAQVVRDDASVIPGLYAIGLDMNSLWRGAPPGNGGNNTLSLTFGYLVAKHLAAA